MSEETAVQPGAELFSDPSLREMIDAGVFYGRTRTRTNPKMRAFILTTRNNIEIINLEKTQELLDSALAFIKKTVHDNGTFLIVGTQPAATEGVMKFMQEFGVPVVVTRWLGGTLTNFKVISKRIEYYKKLKTDWLNESFRAKYTKKERLGIERELENLNIEMSTLENLTDRPRVLVVIDPNVHLAAVKEGLKLHIPIVAFVNTDVNPDLIQYPVPGNNKARVSVNWFIEKVAEAMREAKRTMPVPETKPESKETNEGGHPKA